MKINIVKLNMKNGISNAIVLEISQYDFPLVFEENYNVIPLTFNFNIKIIYSNQTKIYFLYLW